MAVTSKNRQVQEIIKCGKDPVYFLNSYMKIQHPIRGLIKFDTFDFQDECVSSFIDNRFSVILKSRQLGMSTLIAAYSVWLALFQKDKVAFFETNFARFNGIIRGVTAEGLLIIETKDATKNFSLKEIKMIF